MYLKVGDKVKSNGVYSPIIEGEIVGIYKGYHYYSLFCSSIDMSPWFNKDSNWLDGQVYVVEKYIPDIHNYVQKAIMPGDTKDFIRYSFQRFRQRYTCYMPFELEKLPEGYDWTDEVEKKINEDN